MPPGSKPNVGSTFKPSWFCPCITILSVYTDNMTDPYKTPCISARLRQATRQANGIYDQALASHGINIAQYSLLRTIQRLETATLSRLATETQLDASTLGRNVRVLEKLGLVTSEPGQDKRTRVHALTQQGLATSRAAHADWTRVQTQLISNLGPDGYDTLFHLLDALDPDRTGADA